MIEKYRARTGEIIREREHYKSERDNANSRLTTYESSIVTDLSSIQRKEDPQESLISTSGSGSEAEDKVPAMTRRRAGTVTSNGTRLERPLGPARSNSDQYAAQPTRGERQIAVSMTGPRLPPVMNAISARERTASDSMARLDSTTKAGLINTSGGSHSAPVNTTENITSSNIARGLNFAPSPLGQSSDQQPETLHERTQSGTLLPSPPIGSYGFRTDSPTTTTVPFLMNSDELENNVVGGGTQSSGEYSRRGSAPEESNSSELPVNTSLAPDLLPQVEPVSPFKMHKTDQPQSQSRNEPSAPLDRSISQQRKINITPQLLPYTRCTIPSWKIVPNKFGKDTLSFIINVAVQPPGTGKTLNWAIEKLFSSISELDEHVTSLAGGKKAAKQAGLTVLPDGKAKRDTAPSKADQRKVCAE